MAMSWSLIRKVCFRAISSSHDPMMRSLIRMCIVPRLSDQDQFMNKTKLLNNNFNHHLSTTTTTTTAVVSKRELFDEKFVRVLESEIQSAKRSVPTAPTDFPFKMEDDDDDEEIIITLKGEILGEKIRVYAQLGELREGVLLENPQSIVLDVEISKEDGSHLDIQFTASADHDITVNYMNLNNSEFVLYYQFKMLSLDAQQGLKKFLEIRGFNKRNLEFLHKYLLQNAFLHKVKEFVNKE